MKTQILGTGLSGLVGTRIMELLSGEYEFEDLSLATGVDITEYDSVIDRFKKSPSKIVLHMAAKTDVDACEDDKILGEEGGAWLVNVVGTENIVEAAKKTGKKVIYISTDFVFDGTKDCYREDDKPNPVNWYGNTKYEGELLVSQLDRNYLIVRIAYPYRANFPEKRDFVRKIISKMENREKILALSDHILTPTFIDDLAFSLNKLLKTSAFGIYHVVGSQSLTAYESTRLIAKIFNYQADLEPATRSQYFRGRAFRPFKLVLKNDKITGLGIRMKTFEEGLEEMKKQMEI